jgi:hypothetical protein
MIKRSERGCASSLARFVLYIFLQKYAESMQKVCSAKALLLVPIWYSSN